MGELGTRGTTERVHVGNSPPKVARAALLPDGMAEVALKTVDGRMTNALDYLHIAPPPARRGD
jgi:hypothetical protein